MANKLTSLDAAVAFLPRHGCPWHGASEFRRSATTNP